MNTPTKLAVFALGLVAVLGVGATVGSTVGSAPATHAEAPVPHGEGVVAAESGYRLVPLTKLTDEGGVFRFAIEAPDGQRVHRFNATHERELHFILVNRELTSYHHLHPTRGAYGAAAASAAAFSRTSLIRSPRAKL